MISFQTNLASMIAGTNLDNNNNFQTKTITELTSGYRINNSGDDAAGLAVANGYAANIAELTQGVLNANDGVNTLQIIDGGLNNISTMLDRMQTLATESASTTFTGNRETLNTEYQTLIGEINREAGNVGLGSTDSTNAANLSVYIGGGPSALTGSQVNINLSNGLVDSAALGLTGTSVAGTSPVTIGTASNGIIAVGSAETFTVNTQGGTESIGIVGQQGDTVASQLTRLNLALGNLGIQASLNADGDLAFDSASGFSVSVTGAGLANTGDHGINAALYNGSLSYVAADAATQYTISESGTTTTINVATGLSDSAALASINQQLQAAGLTNIQAVADGSGATGAYSLQSTTAFTDAVTTGTGVAGTVNTPTGGGGALDAINAVTNAVQLLGNVQGLVGAGENDLNYAIGLANSQITNFSAAESGIRDADVATEAANLTKAQVLEQSSVAAMAQANSAPQALLQLLKGA